MQDSAAKALRNKRDSSIRVASRLVADGIAQGWFGANGAAMAISKTVQGMIPGVHRPRWRKTFPTLKARRWC